MDCEALAKYLEQLLQHRKDGVVPPQLVTMLTTGATMHTAVLGASDAVQALPQYISCIAAQNSTFLTVKGSLAAGYSSSAKCPFTLLVTGGRAATLGFYGQGETTVRPDTLAHTLYHKGTTSTGGLPH